MADKLLKVVGAAAPLPIDNIDTNVIAPGVRQSQAGKKRGLDTFGSDRQPMNLFARWRFDEADNEKPDFILNRPGFREAKILLAGANFGCGSSRETAVLYLLDFGIQVVIAKSFGEIFYNNCFKHGVLPLAFDAAIMDRLLAEAAPEATFTVDLEQSHVITPTGLTTAFHLPEFRRQGLLQGVDDIGLTLTRLDEIDAFYARTRRERPWAFPVGASD